MRAIVLFFLISGMLTACGSTDSDERKQIASEKNGSESRLRVISTIKPINAIVLAITGDHADVEQLIPDYASPHSFSFKPSDIRKAKSADIIFRIDEYMETQINTVFESLSDNIKVVSLAKIDGLKLLKSNGVHHQQIAGNKHFGLINTDFHIWTSLKNSLQMATEIEKTLSQLDPKNQKYFQENLNTFVTSVNALYEENTQEFKKSKDSKYVVFHNSWQYFATEYGLQKPLIVDLSESFSSGAKTTGVIRSKLKDENIQCVFYDTSVNESRLKLFTEDARVHTAKIDVLAQGVEMSQSTYVNWFSEMSNSIKSCLSN